MNKKLLGVLGVAALLLVGNFAWQGIKEVKAASEGDYSSEVSALLTKYYNSGVYTKDTVINLSEGAKNDLAVLGAFHAGVSELQRTTYFNGGELWMTNDNGVNSGYGTDGENMTHFSKNAEGENVVDYTVENVGGMEGYYVTLADLCEVGEQVWTLESESVYACTDTAVIENFKLVTAPCFLEFKGDLANFAQLSKVTVSENEGVLSLKSYLTLDGTQEGILTDNANNVFAEATIQQGNIATVSVSVADGLIEEDRSVWAWTWSTNIDGAEKWVKATEYDATDNTAKFTLDIATYDNIKVVGCHADTTSPIWDAHPFAAAGSIYAKAEDLKGIVLGKTNYESDIEENYDCPYTLFLVGSATSWTNYSTTFTCTSAGKTDGSSPYVFVGEYTFAEGETFKFRLNEDWGLASGNGDGNNISAPGVGKYKVTINIVYHKSYDNKIWGSTISFEKKD